MQVVDGDDERGAFCEVDGEPEQAVERIADAVRRWSFLEPERRASEPGRPGEHARALPGREREDGRGEELADAAEGELELELGAPGRQYA